MSNKHKPISACCAYRAIIVPKRAARKFYAGMADSLQRCVEAAAGKIEGVKIASVDAEPVHMCIKLIVPPQHAVSEVVSQIKMRTHSMVRKAAISRGMIGEKDDFKTWIPGYFIISVPIRNSPEIAEYVKAALADDERMEVRT